MFLNRIMYKTMILK